MPGEPGALPESTEQLLWPKKMAAATLDRPVPIAPLPAPPTSVPGSSSISTNVFGALSLKHFLEPLLGALEAAAILRYQSGLPYSTYNATGDSLTSDPNGLRLPSYSTADFLIRKPIPLGRVMGSIYLDIRNVFNVTRVEAVRRDTGTPDIDADALEDQARAAYEAHPEPIPYESPRYRAYADLDANGILSGEAELLPLYRRAAEDYNTPVFQYGSPRLFRLGFEVMF